MDACRQARPVPVQVDAAHTVACHLYPANEARTGLTHEPSGRRYTGRRRTRLDDAGDVGRGERSRCKFADCARYFAPRGRRFAGDLTTSTGP